MPATFDSLVTEIRGRSAEEKAELKFLLERELIEERRREIAELASASLQEFERGELKFSSSVDELRKSLG
jgi:hypothetical protein